VVASPFVLNNVNLGLGCFIRLLAKVENTYGGSPFRLVILPKNKLLTLSGKDFRYTCLTFRKKSNKQILN
jgi:hypothetical protein